MKKILGILVCLLICTRAFAGTDGLSYEEGRLTLSEACRTALEHNPDIQTAKERINGARAVVTQAKSLWLPGVTATGHATAIDAVTQPDWRPSARISEAFNEYKTSLDMHWLIFDGFAREANILAATYGVAASEQALSEARRLITQAVSATYYQAQIAIERMKIADQNRDFNRILEKDAKIRYQVGVVPESHVLNFSVRAQQAETDFLAARNAYDLTCTALAQLMGREDTVLDEGVRPVEDDSNLSRSVLSFDTELAFARDHRPDLAAADRQVQALAQKYRAAKGGRYPSLYLISGTDYLYQDQKTYIDEEEHTGYLGVSFQWDLFTGFRKTGEIKAAYADLAAAKEQRRKVLLTLSSDIRKAIFSADTAWETWQRQEETLKMTRSIRESVQKAYRAGKEPLTRLNQAQTDFVTAAGAAASARIQYLIAMVNLNAASGRLN